MAVAFVVEIVTGGPGRWGLSARALSEGRFETLLTHIFSHAGVWHVVTNVTAVVGLASPVVARFGRGRLGLARFALLFLLSGLSGGAVFLLLNPTGAMPMVGASGAICGFWGASMRLPAKRSDPLRGMLDLAVLQGLRDFAVSNAILFLLLAMLSHGRGALAWEAHVGGLLLGLLSIPLFVDDAAERRTQ